MTTKFIKPELFLKISKSFLKYFEKQKKRYEEEIKSTKQIIKEIEREINTKGGDNGT